LLVYILCIAYILTMPIISFANPKGGSGKSTAALILALEFARETKVAVVDADPNTVIGDWKQKRTDAGKSDLLTVVNRPTEEGMLKTLSHLSEDHDFIFVDLEGVASRLLSRALSRSHLVLIPLNPSPIDARLAASAVELVYQESEMLQREIPYRLVWSRYPAAVQTRSFKRIAEEIRLAELNILKTGLVERAAFRDIFEFGSTLDELEANQTSGLDQARGNAHALASELVQTLKSLNGASL
jgi:chromosome partitioning protein